MKYYILKPNQILKNLTFSNLYSKEEIINDIKNNKLNNLKEILFDDYLFYTSHNIIFENNDEIYFLDNSYSYLDIINKNKLLIFEE